MATAKDLLLPDDGRFIGGAADEDQLLAVMSTLADESGDWRGHLPYAAAVAYHDAPERWSQYRTHIDGCPYCQKLIDTIRPSERIVEDLLQQHQKASKGNAGVSGDRIRSTAKWFTPVLPMAASLTLGAGLTAAYFGFHSSNSASPAYVEQVAVKALTVNPNELVDWEQSGDAEGKFKAAQIYFATEHPELAYQRISEGFALDGLDPKVVASIAGAPVLTGDASVSLSEAAEELSQLKDPHSNNEKLKLMQLQAQLGRHDEALASLRDYLVHVGVDHSLVETFSKSVLVADEPAPGGSVQDAVMRDTRE